MGNLKTRRVTWVIAQLTAGGIGPVCRNAAEGIANCVAGSATVVALHDPLHDFTSSGVRYVGLDLHRDVASQFLRWLADNPADILITNDVSYLEPAFAYFPPETLHIVQIHDSAFRYLKVAIRNQLYIDGVVCVANHLTARLQKPLSASRFAGLLATIHNGAVFPARPDRSVYSGPLRLLYLGRMDAFKGISDLVPIMQHLAEMRVPVRLTMAGGTNAFVERKFRRKHLDKSVDWVGFIPHEDCFRLAASHDVFLMPTRKEAFGMATIEAMSMGCVPLAYNIRSGSTEIIQHEKNGFLLPLGRFMSWAKVIQSLSNDREALFNLANAAMQRARGEFNETTLAIRLCDFIQRLEDNAREHRSVRKTGFQPSSTEAGSRGTRYRNLPPTLRRVLRNWVGAHPHLSYWLLKHWA